MMPFGSFRRLCVGCWGDSLTAGTNGQTSYPTQLRSAFNPARTIFNQGVGGETSTQIATRLLAAGWTFPETVVIWAGRNNYTDPTTVKADIASMVGVLKSTRYLVVSIINGDYPNEYRGQPDYDIIVQLNADLGTTYGSRFVDVRGPLVAAYDPNNPQDVIDHSHDVPPSSLRVDNVHLTSGGYYIVEQTIRSALIANGGW